MAARATLGQRGRVGLEKKWKLAPIHATTRTTHSRSRAQERAARTARFHSRAPSRAAAAPSPGMNGVPVERGE